MGLFGFVIQLPYWTRMHGHGYRHKYGYGYDTTTQAIFFKIITWNGRYDIGMTHVWYKYDTDTILKIKCMSVHPNYWVIESILVSKNVH